MDKLDEAVKQIYAHQPNRAIVFHGEGKKEFIDIPAPTFPTDSLTLEQLLVPPEITPPPKVPECVPPTVHDYGIG